ncbi:MAG TPA: hypothetical protein PL131_11615 [Methylotenera sp.]|nr:hypothetical protein [Methylotenera sp.]HPH06513.1 hypothetical protein [Methylotenera sp.]HPN02004.1 hypothetical protein [Methylotenera sp.]
MKLTLLKSSLITGLLMLAAPIAAYATQTLAYFDASSSAKEYHQNYAQDFEKYVANAKTGDTFVLSRITVESHNFAPFGTYTIEAPAKGLSAKRKKELEDEARDEIITAVPIALKQPTEVDATNIIGALTSANDYFKQKNIPVNERVILLFTDGMEQSKINKINMEKAIPKTIPANLVLPADLKAKVYMIGVNAPNKAGAQEAMRNFWQQVISKTGSTLEMFLQRYP